MFEFAKILEIVFCFQTSLEEIFFAELALEWFHKYFAKRFLDFLSFNFAKLYSPHLTSFFFAAPFLCALLLAFFGWTFYSFVSRLFLRFGSKQQWGSCTQLIFENL